MQLRACVLFGVFDDGKVVAKSPSSQSALGLQNGRQSENMAAFAE